MFSGQDFIDVPKPYTMVWDQYYYFINKPGTGGEHWNGIRALQRKPQKVEQLTPLRRSKNNMLHVAMNVLSILSYNELSTGVCYMRDSMCKEKNEDLSKTMRKVHVNSCIVTSCFFVLVLDMSYTPVSNRSSWIIGFAILKNGLELPESPNTAETKMHDHSTYRPYHVQDNVMQTVFTHRQLDNHHHRVHPGPPPPPHLRKSRSWTPVVRWIRQLLEGSLQYYEE